MDDNINRDSEDKKVNNYIMINYILQNKDNLNINYFVCSFNILDNNVKNVNYSERVFTYFNKNVEDNGIEGFVMNDSDENNRVVFLVEVEVSVENLFVFVED